MASLSPQYTRPANTTLGRADILMSGHHATSRSEEGKREPAPASRHRPAVLASFSARRSDTGRLTP